MSYIILSHWSTLDAGLTFVINSLPATVVNMQFECFQRNELAVIIKFMTQYIVIGNQVSVLFITTTKTYNG